MGRNDFFCLPFMYLCKIKDIYLILYTRAKYSLIISSECEPFMRLYFANDVRKNKKNEKSYKKDREKFGRMTENV